MADWPTNLPTRVSDTPTTQERNDLNRVNPSMPTLAERGTRANEIARNDAERVVAQANDDLNH